MPHHHIYPDARPIPPNLHLFLFLPVHCGAHIVASACYHRRRPRRINSLSSLSQLTSPQRRTPPSCVPTQLVPPVALSPGLKPSQPSTCTASVHYYASKVSICPSPPCPPRLIVSSSYLLCPLLPRLALLKSLIATCFFCSAVRPGFLHASPFTLSASSLPTDPISNHSVACPHHLPRSRMHTPDIGAQHCRTRLRYNAHTC